MPTAAQMPRFGPRDVADEVVVVRATPPPIEAISIAQQEEEKEAEDPFVLPASTAPALLQTNSRPKRARGPTLDYKAMHEGKQNQPKRGKEAQQ
jgi:hypothetical protein